MDNRIELDTGWMASLREGTRPSEAMLREHLLAVHRAHAGFTEACAWRCRDATGRNSYQWLAEAVAPDRNVRALDLACGSGPLLALCLETRPRARLTGVDMSDEELALARARVGEAPVALHRGLAQDLDMIPSGGMDVVLCHWALTLMDPVTPVLAEVRRVLAPGGVFAAIVDGPSRASPVYQAVHDVIYGFVQRQYPWYGDLDLGDPRIRDGRRLAEVVADLFGGAEPTVETGLFSLAGPPATLAREASGFFYASFAVQGALHAQMLGELETLFRSHGARDGDCRFAMPVNRLVVRKTG